MCACVWVCGCVHESKVSLRVYLRVCVNENEKERGRETERAIVSENVHHEMPEKGDG